MSKVIVSPLEINSKDGGAIATKGASPEDSWSTMFLNGFDAVKEIGTVTVSPAKTVSLTDAGVQETAGVAGVGERGNRTTVTAITTAPKRSGADQKRERVFKICLIFQD